MTGLVRVATAAGLVRRSPALVALGVPHAFTTRDVDVGPLAGGDPELPARLRALAGCAEGVAPADARQVHGAEVAEVDGALPPEPPRADALVTERPDRLLVVRTADCVPVLVARADGRRVAAIHAGWRGLVAGVLPAALARLGPGELVAAIGPCLSTARFEIGEEVAARFETAGLAAALDRAPGRRPRADLRRAAALQLTSGGVTRIDVADACTWEDETELFSYRRDVTHGGRPTTGRLGALVAPAGAAATPPADFQQYAPPIRRTPSGS